MKRLLSAVICLLTFAGFLAMIGCTDSSTTDQNRPRNIMPPFHGSPSRAPSSSTSN